MKEFTLYTADGRGNPQNNYYPNRRVITDEASLVEALRFDHVCAAYRDGRRNNANFLSADVVKQDYDNDHSDVPADWVTPEMLEAALPDVTFMISFSRHHMKEKGSASARPRMHVIFPLSAPITEAVDYKKMQHSIRKLFPYSDTNALDAARFFYGTENPKVIIYEGALLIDEYLDGADFEEYCHTQDEMRSQIHEGNRNATLSHYAGCVLKRLGNTDEAHTLFLEKAARCTPPLEDAELTNIWRSACSFYERIRQNPDYVPPADFQGSGARYEPGDRSDVGQAELLAAVHSDVIRYSPETDYLVFNGRYWEESNPKAQGVVQLLSEEQLKEATSMLEAAQKEMDENGATGVLALGKNAVAAMSPEQLASYERFVYAQGYQKWAIRRRESKNITATLKEARPIVLIDPHELDRDWFLLNTPAGTIDLRDGIGSLRDHDAGDYITKMTPLAPGNDGRQLWEDALNVFFGHDAEMKQYIQRVVGLSALGKVFVEALIIAYGEGRNGKSTFWNVVARVLGNYSGNISADALTVGCKRNVKPEMAEVRGKRLLIAAELEEGTRLNTSTVKQLCSTDDVYGEKKYKAPLAFKPTHTLVLYTNHLPRVGGRDAGIWRRLIVIPFNAKIEGNGDVKNYADYLYEQAGPAILQWIIEGAGEVIRLGYKIPVPAPVEAAVAQYRDENDWLGHFLADCCEVGNGLEEASGKLYAEYRAYCVRNGDFTRSTTDFYTALENEGIVRQKRKKGMVALGVRLVPEEFREDDEYLK